MSNDSIASVLATLSPEQLAAVKALLASKQPKLSLKVSEKGGVSLYGMGRWPVTLYKSQWLRLLDQADQIRDFITAHDSVLVDKASAD